MKAARVEVNAEMVVRVRVPGNGTEEGRDRFYTLTQLCEQFYRWGRQDEKARWDGEEVKGLGLGWTIGGVSLDTMRSSSEGPRRD